MRLLRSHWGFLLVLALAAALTAAFCWHDGISSIGDDSVSYLALARHYSGGAGPFLEPWLPLHAHFAPLFPLALAGIGGGADLRAAHLLVAAFAVAALLALYRYALLLSRSRAAALGLVVLFLLTPTAWASIKGILSESMYLLVSVLALHHFASRLQDDAGSVRDWIAFGALLAAAYLTRAAGVALVAAFVVHAGLRVASGPRSSPGWRLLVPLAMVAALAALWIALRPAAPVDGYGRTAGAVMASWLAHPAFMLSAASTFLFGGWIASFAVDGGGPLAARAVVAALGLAGVAGAILRAARNRLDGWYVLATLGMLFLWVFDEQNMRRLLYPVVPLLLIHAAFAVSAACAGLRRPGLAARAIAVPAALVALLCLPAAWLTLERARDGAPLIAGSHHGAADITDYYLTVDRVPARALAAKHAAVITGFEWLDRLTPPGARVMWVRPEYVALLGRRAGVPYEYRWDGRALAEAVSRTGTHFIVAAALGKTDAAHATGDPLAVRRLAQPYAEPVFALPNVVAGGNEFVLLRVDPARLAAYLGR